MASLETILSDVTKLTDILLGHGMNPQAASTFAVLMRKSGITPADLDAHQARLKPAVKQADLDDGQKEGS